MPLPEHVKGWNVPITESESGLAVVRAHSLWGWHYEVGQLDEQMTCIDPTDAKAWAVESDRRSGVTLMTVETRGPLHNAHRATAAMLHFCVQVQELRPDQYVTVTRLQSDNMTHLTENVLYDLGFTSFYAGDDLFARADDIQRSTSTRFPEFALAEPIPNVAAV
jgi:hypothetical protein